MNTPPAHIQLAELAELATTVAEITTAWNAAEAVDSHLGGTIQSTGARLAYLLAGFGFALYPKLPKATFSELSTTYLELDTAAREYAQLPEYHTCVRIYERLAPALRLVQRLVAATVPTYPAWETVAEPYADDTDPVERFVATLVVGYDSDTTTDTDPKQAALYALNLTRDEQARSTVWHVHDRHTGKTHRFDQSEFDGDDISGDDDEANTAGEATAVTVVGNTLVLPPALQDAVDQYASALANTASGQLTRAQIEAQYDYDLPEDMGDGPFDIYPGIDSGMSSGDDSGLCTVARAGDYVFCLTCEAQGYLDGYLPTPEDIERWHRDL